MTQAEIQFLIWAAAGLVGLLIAVIAWIGSGIVTQLKNLAEDVGEIKTEIKVATVKHESLEKRVENLETKFV